MNIISWRTIYVEQAHKLSLYLNNLKLDDGEQVFTIPIDDLGMVIINNYRIHITVQLLCKLSQANVCVIICEQNGLPELAVQALNGNYVTFRNQELQLNFPAKYKAVLWQKLVQGKILNQSKNLLLAHADASVLGKMLEYYNSVEPHDLSNREGLAAKMYFRAFFGEHFSREQNSQDPINAALNYGYAIIRSMLARAVMSKGLISAQGIFHRSPYNHFNLVDDYIEVYRPIVDRWVYENMLDYSFTREKRLELINALSKKITFADKKYSVLQSMNYFVDNIINYMKTYDIDYIKIPEVEILDDSE